ncbi:MAG: 16S rRNA (cytosine(967)-C(5))-methyltransferase RsmB [Oscillospiraceae bacterium]|jgi:16S rRNA (cytosine967-C5)-methyltransferase|nr:16S rRNA (cytosine(967)-C(5))-methyltransferase RsmB [Oscillospiraceae bacterium]
MKTANARPAAFALLLKIGCRQSYANLALDALLRREAMPQAEAALCAALVYGVTERRITLDYQLEGLLEKPLSKLPPEALTALRLGLFQLFFLDRIPPRAAIHESVELIKQSRVPFAAGLVNAVLRRAAAQGLRLPERTQEEDAWLRVRYACPDWLLHLWRADYGAAVTEEILQNSFRDSALTLRVNTEKTTAALLLAALKEKGVQGEAAAPPLSGALLLQNGGNVTQLPGFAEGWFHVQDAAAQLCCQALEPRSGETVFDLCAAPGGKSFTLAQMMRDSGRLLAMDLHPQRVGLIAQGAKRLGLRCVDAVQGDALAGETLLGKYGQADRILCDVPCSGLGILRKKPDIRAKMPADIDKLPKMQYDILMNAFMCLKKGGVLVYATCTLHAKENEEVCRRFLLAQPDAQALPVLPGASGLRREGEPFLTLLPRAGGNDGFFIAKFRKKES